MNSISNNNNASVAELSKEAPKASPAPAVAIVPAPTLDDGEDDSKDGHYFLRVVDDTTKELRSRVDEIEADLANNELSDEG